MEKPEIIDSYNKFMRDMDRLDQMLPYYSCCRKTMKSTKEIVLFLLLP
jgi:hypothetical protein